MDINTFEEYNAYPPITTTGKYKLLYKLERAGERELSNRLRKAWGLLIGQDSLAQQVRRCAEALGERDMIIEDLELELERLKRYLPKDI